MDERDANNERDTGISEIWRAAVHPEPPTDLDSRILAAARQAVSRPAPHRQGWWRLAVPFSATAVLVLAVTLLLRVEREAPERLRDTVPPVMRELPATEEGDTQAWQPPASADVEAAKAPTVAPTPTPSALPTATPFVPKAYMKIFLNVPLSGSLSHYGVDISHAAEMAAKQLAGPLNDLGYSARACPV